MLNQRASTGSLVAGLAGSALAISGLAPVAATASPVRATPSPKQGAVVQRVAKADVRIGAKVRPRPVFARRTDSRIKVRVFAPDRQVRGFVQVDHHAFYETARLRKGSFVLKLGKWPSVGQKRVRVHFVGNGWANPATKVVKFKVRRR
jgi:hypothetical protein